ncbi:MAG: glycosyltransferase [Thermomicrobiales bacterium]
MPTCSVIIPVYNGMPLTRQCLDAVFHTATRAVETEIIVVDDHSGDLTPQLLASYGDRLRTVRHEENTGFSTACNDGAAIASGEYLVFLNNDTIPCPGWLDALVHYAERHPNAAVVGSKLVYLNETIQHAGIVVRDDRYPWLIYTGFPADHPAVNVSRRFQAVAAGCALVRRHLFEQVAGFDPAFRNGYEDVDLCFRLGVLGYEIHYCHESMLYHLESSSPGRHDHANQNISVYDSRWKYRVRPDHLDYYVADGLLAVEYGALYPARFSVAPELGTVSDDERQMHADRMLDHRTYQVFRLLEETKRLRSMMDASSIATGADPFASAGRAKLRAFLATRQRLSLPQTDDPLVSIVIPVHNGAAHTYMALESIIAHTHGIPYEVIVVDDGSGDETRHLLECVDRLRVDSHVSNIGFGESCNHGAAMARGRYLCFLNNDTLVTPGWLDALVESLEGEPTRGAAGAKLVYPGGDLQEAGSIIWRDGTTSAYGRGDDPFAPAYCYLREVDYCSAACLVVRAALFRSLGGFDARYAPAYYEDADLCMRLREAGYAVMYVPRAVVIHAEHGSSGQGMAMRLQERNRALFTARWGHRLLSQGTSDAGEEPLRRDRRPGRRLLVIDDSVPVPQFGRGLPRTRALLTALVDAGYVVTYLPIHDTAAHEPTTTELQQIGIEVLHGIADADGAIRQRPDLYDAALISRPHHARFIDVVRAANPRAAIIYDAEAVFALRDAYHAEAVGAPLAARTVEARVRAELVPVGSADVVLTVTETERQVVRRYYPEIPIALWGHAMTIHRTRAGFGKRAGLLFVGYLGSSPNAAAVLTLLNDILPAVPEERVGVLTIVGLDATAEIEAAATRAGTRVVLAGYIVDLAPIYEASRVFVAPHRWAAGVPLKVLEAMSFGVPCVVSALLAQQLGITDGNEALVATTAEEFGAKVARLATDATLWAAIQRAARQFVRDHYDPSVMRQALTRQIEETIARKRATTLLADRDALANAIAPSYAAHG